MHRAIRSLALALVLLILAAGAAHARPPAVRDSPAGLFDTLWQWVASYVSAWNKSGGTMDPNGSPMREGGMMDPDGAKAGVEIDPNGNRVQVPAPPPTTEAGVDIDPDG